MSLLRDSIRPRTKESFDLARSDYARSNVDHATVQSALREVLQIQLQITQVEAELGKAIASLERAVGCEINEHPLTAAPSSNTPTSTIPPPSVSSSPFGLHRRTGGSSRDLLGQAMSS